MVCVLIASSESSDEDEPHLAQQRSQQQQRKKQLQQQNEQNPPATYTNKNGNIIWNVNPPPPSRVRAANIRHVREGLVGTGTLIESETEAFHRFLKAGSVKLEFLSSFVNEFQKVGPETANIREPNLTVLERGTTRSPITSLMLLLRIETDGNVLLLLLFKKNSVRK